MTDDSIRILNIIFALGSLPPTAILLVSLIAEYKKARLLLKPTLTALIFLFGTFLAISIANTIISFFFLTNQDQLATHYSLLRTLFFDASWFTVSWSFLLIRSKSK
ncbi:MAG TPA: hypothetical protein VD999_05845 [Vitreimonas sp.]|nr:hypothetical protein [Vitreimonas sp.]